ncbi:hypothetical protein ACHQM5_019910 [Ranunculus cassubicifolius]
MSTSRDDDPNKPVTGYPYPSQSQPSNPNNGYPYPPQSNTNYPYTAPPPPNYYTSQPYPPPYPNQQQPYDPRRATFLRRILIIMISIFIIFGVITFIFWLVLRPKVPEFHVSSVNVTGFNVTGSQLSGNWEIELLARNPNKKLSVFYEHIEGYMYYRKDSLAATTIAPFMQGTSNETTVKAKFGASGTYVSDYSMGKLNGERSVGSVNFNLRMLGWVRFRSGTWRTRLHSMRIFCDGVTVGLSSNSNVGTLSGGPKRCTVDL